MRPAELPATVLERRAVVYVRQSTGIQVEENLESQRRQYALADLARAYGFREVTTIDADLGLSASGMVARPGFESLVAQLCQGRVGAVFCLEASRLARNGRDWHHLLELCGLVGARVIDGEGVYDPSRPNDRLLLGLKGTMSEFELTVMRQRLVEAAVAKARRGELRICVPVGYVWKHDGLFVDPDRRVQEAIRSVFRLFDTLGSGRKVLLRMVHDGLMFPRPSDGKTPEKFSWRAPSYRNVITVLENPFYAGAYAYGKSNHRTRIVDGRPTKTYGHERPMSEWTVLLREHHEGYISWEQFERNQQKLQANAHRKSAGGAKSGRGGRALLSGLVRCHRCGRMMQVTYSGHYSLARYSCRAGNATHGLKPCITFGAHRPDIIVARQLLDVVQPLALEAAIAAETQVNERELERRRALELERQQAAYEVQIAQRRYEAVDPGNRLVAADLEARWNVALTRLRDCDARMEHSAGSPATVVDRDQLATLAGDLEKTWNAASTAMATKQQLVRALIREIVADVDEAKREIVLVVHWHGGQHSELRIKKPASGEHSRKASPEADAVIREMATQWSAEHIAATLNRMGLLTGQGLTWSARRVESYRTTAGISAYESANKDGRCLTMHEAARAVGATSHAIRRLINKGILPARQVVKDAPWQIQAADLERPEVQEALRRRQRRGQSPCRNPDDPLTLRIPGT